MNSKDYKKEEWLGVLKEKISHYQEPIPVGSWDKLEAELGKANVPVPRIKWHKRVAMASAVAAIVLVFWMLFPLQSNVRLEAERMLSVVEPMNAESIGEKTSLPGLIAENKQDRVFKTVVDENFARELIAIKEEKVILLNDKLLENKQDTLSFNTSSSAPVVQSATQPTKRPLEQSQTTWEEYLSDNLDSNTAPRKKGEDWLALAVGNNGVGTFDPRTVEGVTTPRMMQDTYITDASIAQMSGVKDLMLYKRPENIEMSSSVSTIEPEYKHKQPLSFGVKFGKSLSNKFTIETGVVYSLLRSDIKNLQKDKTVKQALHYLGIPVRLNWNFVNKQKYMVYMGVGGMIEKCVYGELDNKKIKIKSLQTSLNLSVGAQYKFNPTVGVYFEPGLSYYFGMKEDGSLGKTDNGVLIKSIHSENPLGFTLQAGFRFSF